MSDRHDPIQDATARLAREVQPSRDLWPEIASRLDATDEPDTTVRVIRRPFWQRHAGWLAAAAVLTVIIVSPSFRRDSVPADVAGLDRDYASARADLVTLVENRCGELPATACAPLMDGLALLDRTADGLSTALTTLATDAPERPALVARYRSTLDRTRNLRIRVARL